MAVGEGKYEQKQDTIGVEGGRKVVVGTPTFEGLNKIDLETSIRARQMRQGGQRLTRLSFAVRRLDL